MNIFLGMVGPWQVVTIVALILLLFGGKKIPELMCGLGTDIREFKDATRDPAKDNERIGKPKDEQINKSANWQIGKLTNWQIDKLTLYF